MKLGEIFDKLQPRIVVQSWKNDECKVLYDTSNKPPYEIINSNFKPEDRVLNMNVDNISVDDYGMGILIINVSE